jgi:hypothetical protein
MKKGLVAANEEFAKLKTNSIGRKKILLKNELNVCPKTKQQLLQLMRLGASESVIKFKLTIISTAIFASYSISKGV